MIRDKLFYIIENGNRTDTSKNLAEYILFHIQEIPEMSIYQLAEACYVSPASISRFCHKIGYPDFAELKESCVFELQLQELISSQEAPGGSPPSPAAGQSCFQPQLFHLYPQLLHSISVLSVKSIQSLANDLYQYDNIYFLGSGFASPLYTQLQMKLYSFGKCCRILKTLDSSDIETEPSKNLGVVFSMHGHYLACERSLHPFLRQHFKKHWLVSQSGLQEQFPHLIYWKRCASTAADWMSWMFVADQIISSYQECALRD